MEPQKPSIGRIVHYHETQDAPPRAAIITRVWSDTLVNLHVFDANTEADMKRTSVTLAGYQAGGAEWRWPPRV